MQPIQNSFDSSANYIIEDDLITADVEIVPDVNDVSISNSVPCQNDNQPSGVKRKKISDVYESISTYTQKKIQKTCSADQKLKLEIEMLEIKKKKLKKESAEDKIQIYKTGGGTAPPKNITDEKSRLLSLLQPQMQPIQNSFDSSANYIIEDDLITADVEIVPDVNDVSISNSVPCQNDNQPSGVKRKKISDVPETEIRNRNVGNKKKKLKKESAEDKIQIYKTGGGTAPPKNITDEKSRLLSLLQPQMQPIQNSFDSSANYIIEDDLITADVEIVPDVNDVSISNSVPCQNDNQPSGVKRKKISDVYESISTYTQKKIQKTCSADQKLKLEIEMLEIKKKKLKKESAEDKIQIYKTGGGTAPPKNITDEKSRLLSLLQPQMQPIQNSFDSSANYIIEDDLEKALKKIAQAEETSNLEDTDYEDRSIKRKRLPPKRIYSSDDEDDHTNIRKPPPVKLPKFNNNVHTKSRPTFSGPSLLHQIQSDTSPMRSTIQTSNVNEETTNIISNDKSYHFLVNQLLPRIIMIEEQNAQILTLIRQNNQNGFQSTLRELSLNISLPLKTLEDLDNAEVNLLNKDNFTQLGLYLSSLGGNCLVGKTNRILKELFADYLAAIFNFCGGKNKRPFKELQICALVTLKKLIPDATILAIENAIKVWLKHAPQRIKLFQLKMQRNNNIDISNNK
ncbi:hypothetical protein FQR65_LT15947 [Abscondita terminalis]|nr:hypothetical protein FQR65_LT15947 [Abscondita terminalis]